MSKKAAFFLTFIVCTCAFGNPTGHSVIDGNVDIQVDGSSLNITVSDRSIIEWQDFSIGAGETTRFIQPSTSSVLNRVTSNIPSSIYGQLLSDGTVYLMNPNGILVGASGVINTGGFLATTLDQGPSNFFKDGGLELSGDSDAAIVNLGNITATGDIFLVAREIDNQGVIKSINGMVGLAAGKDVLLKESGEERIFIRPVGEGEINSTGTIEALNIEIKSRGNPYSMAINLEGQLTANKVNEVDGRVFLSADNGNIELGEDLAVVADELTIYAGNGSISTDSNTALDDVNVATVAVDNSITITPTDVVNITASDVELIGSTGSINLETSILADETVIGTADNITISLSTDDADSLIGGDTSIVNTIPISDNSDDLRLIVGSPVSGSAIFQESEAIGFIKTSSGNTIEYSTFNILEGETVNFLQPSGDVSVLNRISSDTPTEILGVLTANATIYIANPSGIENGISSNNNISISDGSNMVFSGGSNMVFSGNAYFSNSSSLVIQPTVFRPVITQPAGGFLDSSLFSNIKSGKSVVQDLHSTMLEDNSRGTLLAKFSTQAEDDGTSIINLDR